MQHGCTTRLSGRSSVQLTKQFRLLAPLNATNLRRRRVPTQLSFHLAENEDDVLDLIARCEGEYRLACPSLLVLQNRRAARLLNGGRHGACLRVENRACSAPRLLLCLGQRDELFHVTWHRVEPTAGPLLLRLLDALWPG